MVDENTPLISVKALRSLRHNVTDIRGTQDQGLTDNFLWELSQREKRLLITTDKGFAQYRHEKHCSVLIVRLRQPNRRRIHERVLNVLEQYEPDEWPGTLVVARDAVQSVWRTTVK